MATDAMSASDKADVKKEAVSKEAPAKVQSAPDKVSTYTKKPPFKKFSEKPQKEGQEIQPKQKIDIKKALEEHQTKIAVPSIEDLMKAGVHFGHETKRWDPKMSSYIFATKEGIHIIDLEQTQKALEKAIKFLSYIAKQGQVVLVGTKRQASRIVEDEAIKAGCYFVSNRWAGGLLTNFKEIKKSLKKLNDIEKSFEEGVEGRTKYEVSQLKKEWQRLNRLYAGIKAMNDLPVAAVIIDAKYEKNVIRECQALGIATVALIDTNTDPAGIDYPIPCNDDAISSLRLLMKVLSDAVKEGNKGKELVHRLKDYSKYEVAIVKVGEAVEEKAEIDARIEDVSAPQTKVQSPKKPAYRGTKSKGILERVQEEKEKAKK